MISTYMLFELKGPVNWYEDLQKRKARKVKEFSKMVKMAEKRIAKRRLK